MGEKEGTKHKRKNKEMFHNGEGLFVLGLILLYFVSALIYYGMTIPTINDFH